MARVSWTSAAVRDLDECIGRTSANYAPVRSPEGAPDNSPGRKPWVGGERKTRAPKGRHMATPDPANLVAWYAEGRITRGELVTRLAQSAVDHAPAAFASAIPPELMDELRRLADDLQAAERARFARSVSVVGEFDARAWEDRQRRQYVDGLRVWRTYFDDAR